MFYQNLNLQIGIDVCLSFVLIQKKQKIKDNPNGSARLSGHRPETSFRLLCLCLVAWIEIIFLSLTKALENDINLRKVDIGALTINRTVAEHLYLLHSSVNKKITGRLGVFICNYAL